MSVNALTLTKKPEKPAKDRIIAALREHLQRAEAGDLTGLILLGITDTPKTNKFTRHAIGLLPSEVVCALARAEYKFNQDWDRL